MFRSLNEQSVPLLIFSAGVGDVIEETIRQKLTYYPNIKVVSNFMDFDNDVGPILGIDAKFSECLRAVFFFAETFRLFVSQLY